MSIILEQLTKHYDGQPVVNDVSLEVTDGEFFVLLGSSGSGKTTILSMIAGLTPADSGRILLHGRDVTRVPARERKVGFVFQHYALFQHMSVADNVAFGLRVRKVPAVRRRQRVEELLELVGMTGLGSRMPHQISGGQQQRVALARALAFQPEVLLLDEPLGALDAKIRLDLRRTLRAIQRELGITTILVTHDQEEAFELADRLGVMSFGRLLEVGPPHQLYCQPQTEFVATFLGTANLLVGQGTPEGVQVGPLRFPPAHKPASLNGNGNGRVQVLFRPEDVTLAASPQALGVSQLARGEVEESVFAGSFERLRLRLPPISGVRPIAPPVPFGGGAVLVEASRSQTEAAALPLRPGDKVWVGVRRVHALAHPGLNFLIVSDGSAQSQAALLLGGQIARLAHARLTLLGCGQPPDVRVKNQLQTAKEQLGGGLTSLQVKSTAVSPAEAIAREVEHQPFDLVVLGLHRREEDVVLAEQILQAGEHHLLLVPNQQPTPARALICVASGEPGKEDVLFAGRLVRHLGAEATLLAVLTEEDVIRSRTERFMAAGARTLELLGVPAATVIRSGPVRQEITNEMSRGGYDMLVMGAPLSRPDGRISLNGIVGQLLQVINRAILIVHSAAP